MHKRTRRRRVGRDAIETPLAGAYIVPESELVRIRLSVCAALVAPARGTCNAHYDAAAAAAENVHFFWIKTERTRAHEGPHARLLLSSDIDLQRAHSMSFHCRREEKGG